MTSKLILPVCALLPSPQPHESLANIESAYEIEHEKPGEVAELEGIVMKAMESGKLANPEVSIEQ